MNPLQSFSPVRSRHRRHTHNDLLQLTLLVLTFIFWKETLGDCPSDSVADDLYRLATSRFYVIQKGPRGALPVNYYEAKTHCAKHNLRLAQIPNFPTDVHVSRKLENFMKNHTGWYNAFYWIDAAFNEDVVGYFWENDTTKPLEYTNFYYQHPRPKGLGSFFIKSGYFVKNPINRMPACLTIGMPNKPDDDGLSPINKGLATSWWERPCFYQMDNSVLCESTDPECEQSDPNKSVFTDVSADFYKEFWLMSNRRYVVSWLPQDFESAKALCEKNKMKVLTPTTDDACLSPSLKQWMKTLTVYSFWTDVKYNMEDWQFVYPNATTSQNAVREYTRTERAEGMTEKTPICASYFWNNEVPPSNFNYCNCTYDSVVLSPENCKNRIGVICQPNNVDKIPCTMEFVTGIIVAGSAGTFKTAGGSITVENVEKIPKFQEFYFFDGKPAFKRSAFKQKAETQAPCPDGYDSAGTEDTYWGTPNDFINSQFPYDYTSSYWLPTVDAEDETVSCFSSRVNWDEGAQTLSREVVTEVCETKWAFVLCKKSLPEK